MRYLRTGSTEASPAAMWAVLCDVERWPEWIETYEKVQRSDSGPLAVAKRATIKQKGLPAGQWVVTEYVEGEGFSWTNRQPGVLTIGRHLVAPGAGGGSLLTLVLEQSGWLAGVLAWLFGRRVRRYVDLEFERLTAVAAARR
jgi:Polyketide cyclase / dehydrase and lipid transport